MFQYSINMKKAERIKSVFKCNTFSFFSKNLHIIGEKYLINLFVK